MKWTVVLEDLDRGISSRILWNWQRFHCLIVTISFWALILYTIQKVAFPARIARFIRFPLGNCQLLQHNKTRMSNVIIKNATNINVINHPYVHICWLKSHPCCMQLRPFYRFFMLGFHDLSSNSRSSRKICRFVVAPEPIPKAQPEAKVNTLQRKDLARSQGVNKTVRRVEFFNSQR